MYSSETWKSAKKMIKADLLRDAQLYRIRMSTVGGNHEQLLNTECQMLSACNDYNMVLQGKKEASSQERWRLIFHTDQSLL